MTARPEDQELEAIAALLWNTHAARYGLVQWDSLQLFNQSRVDYREMAAALIARVRAAEAERLDAFKTFKDALGVVQAERDALKEICDAQRWRNDERDALRAERDRLAGDNAELRSHLHHTLDYAHIFGVRNADMTADGATCAKCFAARAALATQ